jgi:hypothetical protein
MTTLRGVVRWALWSPRRLLLVLAASLVLVVVIGSYVGRGSSSHERSIGGRSAPPVHSVALAKSLHPRRAKAEASDSSLPAGAGAAAVAFVRAWARPGLAEVQWFAALQPLVTSTYANVLQDEEPWSVQAHRVTGPPAGSGDSQGATVTVPTDAGTVVVTAVRSGTSWLVANVGLSP